MVRLQSNNALPHETPGVHTFKMQCGWILIWYIVATFKWDVHKSQLIRLQIYKEIVLEEEGEEDDILQMYVICRICDSAESVTFDPLDKDFFSRPWPRNTAALSFWCADWPSHFCHTARNQASCGGQISWGRHLSDHRGHGYQRNQHPGDSWSALQTGAEGEIESKRVH